MELYEIYLALFSLISSLSNSWDKASISQIILQLVKIVRLLIQWTLLDLQNV